MSHADQLSSLIAKHDEVLESRRNSIVCGDCREILKDMLGGTFSACITDPPYELGFMAKVWDQRGVSFDPKTWKAVLRVLKPGAFLLAFGGTRTFHRIACAIEDAGFEIRDTIMWVYGTGFPKSLNISKAIDKSEGAKREVLHTRKLTGKARVLSHGSNNYGGEYGRQPLRETYDETAPSTDDAKRWDGYGTALKPAWEPIIVAMKPTDGTFIDNALNHGVAGLNIDGCRVGILAKDDYGRSAVNACGTVNAHDGFGGKAFKMQERDGEYINSLGRWPANLIHDGSDEVLDGFPESAGQRGDLTGHAKDRQSSNGCFGKMGPAVDALRRNDSGSAARFFYCAKAQKSERGEGNTHPTVKPLALMQYLLKLVTYPTGNYILDPFCGSGSTLVACRNLELDCFGIDLDNSSVVIAKSRI